MNAYDDLQTINPSENKAFGEEERPGELQGTHQAGRIKGRAHVTKEACALSLGNKFLVVF